MATTMRFSCLGIEVVFTIFILLSSTQFPIAAGDDQLIIQTCKTTPLVDVCLKTLQSDLRSKSEDVAGLGLVVVDAIKRKTVVTVNQIIQLQASSSSNLNQSLQICLDSCKFILDVCVPETEQAIRGIAKFAEDGMIGTAQETETCGHEVDSKICSVSSLNNEIHDLSIVARAIIRNLL